MSDDESTDTVVIDNGSGTFLAGFAGDGSPRCIIRPTSVGRRKFQTTVLKEDSYIGDKTYKVRELLSFSYPVERGIVTNWDDMEEIWRYAYKHELRTKSEEMAVLVADATLNPIGNREKMIQVMMESLLVPAFQVMNQGILSLYASGRTTGSVFTLGDGVCHVNSVYEAVPELCARRREEIAGRDLTLYLQRLLQNRGYSFTTSAEIELVKDMKEKLCFVNCDAQRSLDVTSCSPTDLDESYTLPDGNQLTLGIERYMCPDALFQPSSLGLEFDGIHHLVKDSIEACEICVRPHLYSNIILSGSSTMFPGFSERIMHEIKGLTSDGVTVKVIAPPERRSSAWIGGSVVASLSSFSEQLISRKEYEEYGPGIVHRKCSIH